MKNNTPSFIHDRFKSSQQFGVFPCSAVTINLSGLPGIIEKLKDYKNEGYTEFTANITKIYTPIIETIYRHGGFICKFFSDQFIAVFPHEIPFPSADNAILCSLSIIKKMKDLARIKTPFGDYFIFCKIGIGTGNADWGIFGKKEKSYYFKGDSFIKSYMSISAGALNRVTLDESTAKSIADENIKSSVFRQKNFFYAESVDSALLSTEFADPKYSEINDESFTRTDLSKLQDDDFSQITSLLTSFDDRAFDNEEELIDFLSFVSENSRKDGLLFGGLIHFKPNPHLTFYFESEEAQNIENALKSIFLADREFKISTRTVLTRGISYVGLLDTQYYKDFVCISRSINTAEMILTQTTEKGILITEEINEKIKDSVNTLPHSSFVEKGSVKETRIFKVINKKTSEPAKGLFKERIVYGEKCLKFVKPFFDKKFPGIIYIYGEQGSGKTFFANELSKKLKSSVFHLHGNPMFKESLRPFKDFFNDFFFKEETAQDKKDTFIQKYEIFLKKCQSSTSEGNVVLNEELIRTPTIIAALTGLEWENSVYNSIEQCNRFENSVFAIKNFMLSVAFLNPLILILDDFQYFDRDSLSVIQVLTRDIANRQLLIIATARCEKDSEKPKLLLDEDVPSLEIELTKTSLQAMEEYIVSFLGEDCPGKLINKITILSSGNPCLAEQLCLLAGESQEPKEEMYSKIQGKLNEIAAKRIDFWEEKLRDSVFFCAVLGNHFDKKSLIVTNPSKIEDSKLVNFYDSLLDEVVKKQIWTYIAPNHIFFRNEELRKSIVQNLSEEKRTALHLEAAKALEALFGDDKTRFIEIAYHFYSGGDSVKAVKYYVDSAEWSFFNYRLEESAGFLRTAYEIENDLTKKFEIILKMFSVQKEMKVFQIDEILYGQADEYFRSENDISSSVKLLYYRAHSFLKEDDKDRALEYIEQAKNLAEENQQTELLPEIYKFYVPLLIETRRFEKAEKSLDSFEKLPEKTVELHLGDILSFKGIILMNRGKFDQALEMFDKAVSIFDKNKNLSGMAPVLDNISKIYFKKGKAGKALEYSIKSLNVGKEIGSYKTMVINLHNIGGVFMKARDFNKAVKFLEQSQRLSRELKNYKLESYVLDKLGDIERARGYMAEAMSFYERSLENRLKLGDLIAAGKSFKFIGDVLSSQNNFDKAKEYYVKSMSYFKKADDRKSLAESIESFGTNEFKKDKQNKFKTLKCLEHAWNIYESLSDYDRLTNLEKLINQVTWEGIDI